jgi:hypothetical protein
MFKGIEVELDVDQKEYLIEEYRRLHEELLLSFQRMDSAEKNALLASGAIWAWLATHEQTVQYQMAVWVPLCLCVMFAVKGPTLRYGQKRIEKYVRLLEQQFGIDDKLGWVSQNRMVPGGLPIGIGLWPVAYWGAMIIANALGAVIFLN